MWCLYKGKEQRVLPALFQGIILFIKIKEAKKTNEKIEIKQIPKIFKDFLEIKKIK